MENNDKLIQLAAGCGLHCGTCSLYIGSTEVPERLKNLSARMGQTIEQLTCYGCRSEKKSNFCQNCNFIKCLDQKGLNYCGQCSDYPCNELKEFQKERPHRINLWDDMKCLLEKGIEKWDSEVIDKYKCPTCGTINSAYDLACRKCGQKPSCKYVETNYQQIEAAMK